MSGQTAERLNQPTRLEVLRDLEPVVEALMQRHLSKRTLWYPSQFLPADEQTAPDEPARTEALRERARGLPDSLRVSLALNLLTEEGLPHFHRLIAQHLGYDSVWAQWNNLWTAEEDRHGCVLRDYVRDARVFNMTQFEHLQYQYLEAGFNPDWQNDPYRLLAYTSLQERATQFAHANTGRRAGACEPLLQKILAHIASDEARHFAFYREAFKGVLERDTTQALQAAAAVLPALSMPGHTIAGFPEMADVVRRAGFYGPWDYKAIVEDVLEFWGVGNLRGLDAEGTRAQETLMRLPQRLARFAEYIEKRTTSKSFSFDFIYDRELTL